MLMMSLRANAGSGIEVVIGYADELDSMSGIASPGRNVKNKSWS